MSNPRPEVVLKLSDLVMEALAESQIEKMSPAEVLSACFTACKRVMEGVLSHSDPADLNDNKQIMVSAVADLYAAINPVKH